MLRKIKIVGYLLVLVAFVALMPGVGLAQSLFGTTTGTLGNQNSSGDYAVTVTNDNVVHFAQDTGLLFPYTTASTNQTLTAVQTGVTLVFNNGAGTANNLVIFTLPTAAVGMSYSFIADIAKSFRIKPQSADIINFSTAVAGSKINNGGSGAAGDAITLFCATAGKWSIKYKVGTWAVDNNPG